MKWNHDMMHEWHVAINRHNDGKRGEDFNHWLYEAKTMAQEVPRLALLFARERSGGLTDTHKQCSHSLAEPVPDNHLTCCLGVKCKECPELLAIEKMKRPPEEIDQAKAWTCATHIVSNGGDEAREGYILTVDDRMFWDRVYSSMAQMDE